MSPHTLPRLAEAHRQSLLVATGSTAEVDQAFVDALSTFNEEDPDTRGGVGNSGPPRRGRAMPANPGPS
jgi:hypothetical protein